MRLSGKDINVRAAVRRIESYSAHADRDELAAWIRERHPIRGGLFLDHGESEAIEAVRSLVQSETPGLAVVAPAIGESFALTPGAAPKRIQTGRVDLAQLAGEDWQNDYADFAANLKHNLAHIRSEKARRKALDEMRRVLAGYEAARSEQKRRRGAA